MSNIKDNIVKPTIILAAIALISAVSLAYIKTITSENIKKQEKEKLNSALSMVLPTFKIGEEQKIKIDGNEFVYWKAEKIENDKTIIGYAFITMSPGYSGNVQSLVGVDSNGVVQGISILQQTETPGLGAKCNEVSSKLTFIDVIYNLFKNGKIPEENSSPWFQEQFNGLDLNKKIKIVKKGNWRPELKNELLQQNAISAITGATITSRAVVNSLQKGISILNKIKENQEMKEKNKEIAR